MSRHRERLRSDGFFTPPSLKGTLVVPGNVGGMAWGGMAHDRVNDLLDHAREQSSRRRCA